MKLKDIKNAWNKLLDQIKENLNDQNPPFIRAPDIFGMLMEKTKRKPKQSSSHIISSVEVLDKKAILKFHPRCCGGALEAALFPLNDSRRSASTGDVNINGQSLCPKLAFPLEPKKPGDRKNVQTR